MFSTILCSYIKYMILKSAIHISVCKIIYFQITSIKRFQYLIMFIKHKISEETATLPPTHTHTII